MNARDLSVPPNRPPSQRVVLDALSARFGGAAYSTLHIAGKLADDPAIDEVIVVTRTGSLISQNARDYPGVKLVQLAASGRAELLHRLWWEAVTLPDLLGGRTPVHHGSGILPRRLPSRVVCYLANPLIFIDDGIGNRLRRWGVQRTSQWAFVDLTVPTRGMGDLVAAATGRQAEVVPLGIDHDVFAPANETGDEVLLIGDFYPHKRHAVALAAWAALPEPRPALRVIGQAAVNPSHARKVLGSIERLRSLGPVITDSGLSLNDLVAAYHRARVMLLCSESESFSMPLLEAQASGVPAVVRDLESLRETGGAGTTFVAGDDSEAWARALRRMLEDDGAHMKAREAGFRHAAHYSWERTAAGFRDRLLHVG